MGAGCRVVTGGGFPGPAPSGLGVQAVTTARRRSQAPAKLPASAGLRHVTEPAHEG